MLTATKGPAVSAFVSLQQFTGALFAHFHTNRGMSRITANVMTQCVTAAGPQTSTASGMHAVQWYGLQSSAAYEVHDIVLSLLDAAHLQTRVTCPKGEETEKVPKRESCTGCTDGAGDSVLDPHAQVTIDVATIAELHAAAARTCTQLATRTATISALRSALADAEARREDPGGPGCHAGAAAAAMLQVAKAGVRAARAAPNTAQTELMHAASRLWSSFRRVSRRRVEDVVASGGKRVVAGGVLSGVSAVLKRLEAGCQAMEAPSLPQREVYHHHCRHVPYGQHWYALIDAAALARACSSWLRLQLGTCRSFARFGCACHGCSIAMQSAGNVEAEMLTENRWLDICQSGPADWGWLEQVWR